MVLVSVLMSSYNHDKYIAESIESVLNQTIRDFELVIIDDYSKDKSRKIIEEYQRKDSRIKAIFHKKNLGIPATFNHLLDEASGTYIAYLASDDVWTNLKLEKQLAVLAKNNSSIVWSEGEIIDERGISRGTTFTEMHFASRKKKSGYIFEELVRDNFIFGSSMIYKKDLLGNLRFNLNLKMMNDYLFYVQIARNHPFVFIKEPLAKYRIHGKNTIFSDNKTFSIERILVKNFLLHEYRNLISKETKANLYFAIGYDYVHLSQDEQAKYFFIQSLKNQRTIWTLIFVLSNGKGKMGNFLKKSFVSSSSVIQKIKLAGRLLL